MFAEKGNTVILTALTRLFDPSLVDAHDVLKDSSDVVAEYVESCGVRSDAVARQEIEGFVQFVTCQIVSNRKVYNSFNDVLQLAIKSRERYPLIDGAAERLLVAPVSTMDCERGFSQQNLIKIDLRNSRSVKT